MLLRLFFLFQRFIFPFRVDELLNGIRQIRDRIQTLSVVTRPIHNLLKIVPFLIR